MAENPVNALKGSIARQKLQRDAAISTSRKVSEDIDKENEEKAENKAVTE